MRTSFHHHLMRSTLIFRYQQAGRPITPSFGGIVLQNSAILCGWGLSVLIVGSSHAPV